MIKHLVTRLAIVVGVLACTSLATNSISAATKTATTSGNWSSTATWGGSLPTVNDDVVIPSGVTVTFDGGNREVMFINIQSGGTLNFANQDFYLKTIYIHVMGNLNMGTANQRYTANGTVEFYGTPTSPGKGHMGTKGLLVAGGGNVNLFGVAPNPVWTRLTQTANKGSSTISVENASSWKAGDRIVLASTDYDYKQAEERTIVSKNGNTLTLDSPLNFMHFGQQQTYDGKIFETRGEVGLINRNLKFMGDEASTQNGFGGHMMFMKDSKVFIDGIELTRMGQRGLLARYPIHCHLCQDVSGMYVKNVSVHHTFNRSITIHQTNNWLIENNLFYDAEGHMVFFEDGYEVGNVVKNNLALVARNAVIPTIQSDDEHRFSPGAYWISNPNNTIIGNVAAGSRGIGFWYDMDPLGGVKAKQEGLNTDRVQFGVFENNVSHSNGAMGVFVDQYFPPTVSVLQQTHTYKNRGWGIWVDSNGIVYNGKWVVINDARVADSRVGTIMPGYGKVTNSVIVAETANKGTPQNGEATGLDGRTLPEPGTPETTLHGHRFYVGPVHVSDTTYVGFKTNSLRPAGVIGYRVNLVSGAPIGNQVERIKLIDSNPVFVDQDPVYRTAYFYDKDGSFASQPGTYITSSHPMAYNANSIYHPEWQGYETTDPLAYLTLRCQSGCHHKVMREDGAYIDWTYGIDGRFWAIENKQYWVYRGDSDCSFEVSEGSENVGNWYLLSLHYTCSLDRVESGGSYTGNLSSASSIEEVKAAKGRKYYFDQAKNKLHILLYNGRSAGYNEELLVPTWEYLRVYGTGSNQVTSPQEDPNGPGDLIPPTPGTTPTPNNQTACQKADIDQSGVVNISDFTTLLNNFGRETLLNARADINGDGKVNIQDFSLLLVHFGSSCG